ncbi:DUF6985 domain-containing protein [Planctomyces sp. SH-PL14]|uniref:DUF6985 domain-containing protein n=1 Tax=Planctomyces sp. SH-PL14 TaxID=1632864 RepID=UPI00078D612F|nr:hypothetical protein [Planctomyces sp. SH-PL14]AMV19956.1 hypothetical protein VT03_18810 [Planctomyces sp. SH-PL14]
MKLKAQTHPVIGDLAPDQWGDSLMCFREIPGLAAFIPEEAKETLKGLDPPDRKLVESWPKPGKELIERCRDFDIFDALRARGVFEVQFSGTPTGSPSSEQVAAFEFFRANEAAISRNIGDALLRYYRAARAEDEDWFDESDCPAVKSVAELAKLATVDGVTFMKHACEGTSLVSITWQVAWDEEHGLSMTLLKDQVVGLGTDGEDMDFEDNGGVWNRKLMTEPERQARGKVAACASAFEDDDDEDEDFDDDDFEDEEDDEDE